MKVCPEFPWELITHDRSSAPSRMYKDFRGFHCLGNDPCQDLKDSEVTDRELDLALGGDIDEHRDELLKNWKSKFEAFGEDPVELARPSLNLEASVFRPDETHSMSAPSGSTALVHNAPGAGYTGQQGDISGRLIADTQGGTSPGAQQSSCPSVNLEVIQPALANFWEEIREYESWQSLASGMIVSPWEIKLPHERVTSMLLPNHKTIETEGEEGIMVHVVRRGMGGHTLTLAIEISHCANTHFSPVQEELVRGLWKCILRWIITIAEGAMIKWENWRFLWKHKLYHPMKEWVNGKDTWDEFCYAMDTIHRDVAQRGRENNLSMPQAFQQYEDTLVVAGHTMEQINRRLQEVISSSIPPNYKDSDVLTLIEKLRSVGIDLFTGAPLEAHDDFFMFAMSTIYIFAQMNLEREGDGTRKFSVARMIYAGILSFADLGK